MFLIEIDATGVHNAICCFDDIMRNVGTLRNFVIQVMSCSQTFAFVQLISILAEFEPSATHGSVTRVNKDTVLFSREVTGHPHGPKQYSSR